MSISNKYNIPEETVKKMVKDGIVYRCVAQMDEVYELFKSIKAKNPNKSKSEIYRDISESKDINFFTVKQMVARADKI